MALLIDSEGLSLDQRAELYEEGQLRLIQGDDQAKPVAEIKLDAAAAMKLYDFLVEHLDRLNQWARKQE